MVHNDVPTVEWKPKHDLKDAKNKGSSHGLISRGSSALYTRTFVQALVQHVIFAPLRVP